MVQHCAADLQRRGVCAQRRVEDLPESRPLPSDLREASWHQFLGVLAPSGRASSAPTLTWPLNNPISLAAVTISPAIGAAVRPPYPACSTTMENAIRCRSLSKGAYPANHAGAR